MKAREAAVRESERGRMTKAMDSNSGSNDARISFVVDSLLSCSLSINAGTVQWSLLKQLTTLGEVVRLRLFVTESSNCRPARCLGKAETLRSCLRAEAHQLDDNAIVSVKFSLMHLCHLLLSVPTFHCVHSAKRCLHISHHIGTHRSAHCALNPHRWRSNLLLISLFHDSLLTRTAQQRKMLACVRQRQEIYLRPRDRRGIFFSFFSTTHARRGLKSFRNAHRRMYLPRRRSKFP